MTKFLAVVVVVLAILLFVGHFVPDFIPNIPLPRLNLSGQDVIRQTMQLLRGEYLKFLVTRKLSTHVVLEKDAGNWLLGHDSRLLVAKVDLYWGMDLAKIGQEAISATLDGVIVTLPEPEVLECAVDFGSARTWRRRSGINWLIDQVGGQEDQDLLDTLHLAEENALGFFREQGLLPSRQALVDDMNEWAGALGTQVGGRIWFR